MGMEGAGREKREKRGSDEAHEDRVGGIRHHSGCRHCPCPCCCHPLQNARVSCCSLRANARYGADSEVSEVRGRGGWHGRHNGLCRYGACRAGAHHPQGEVGEFWLLHPRGNSQRGVAHMEECPTCTMHTMPPTAHGKRGEISSADWGALALRNFFKGVI